MRKYSISIVVRAPPFPGGVKTSSKMYSNTMAEQTFLPFASVALLATVVGYDDGFRSAGASSLDIVHGILLELKQIIDQPAG